MKFTIAAFGTIVLIWILQTATVKSTLVRKRTSRRERGAVYIRWGHDECPRSKAMIVYSGYAGGSLYSHYGAATNYLCLVKDPSTPNELIPNTYFGYLYGAEYQNLKNQLDLDVPCAVCQSRYRNSFMLPGKDICPRGWRVEYKGLLMAGYYGHVAGSEYVCVDSAKRVLNGGHRDENGKLFYPVRAVCGSLRCPPYTKDQLVACAVCSR